MGAITSQITSLTIVYSNICSDADQRKHQSSASLAFVWGIHRWPVNSPHKWPVTRKMFPFDDVITIRAWVNNHIHVKQCEVNTHLLHNFNGGFTKQPLNSGPGWVITQDNGCNYVSMLHSPIQPACLWMTPFRQSPYRTIISWQKYVPMVKRPHFGPTDLHS